MTNMIQVSAKNIFNVCFKYLVSSTQGCVSISICHPSNNFMNHSVDYIEHVGNFIHHVRNCITHDGSLLKSRMGASN